MNAGGDALKSDQDNDDTKGYVSIMDGTVTLTYEGEEVVFNEINTIPGFTSISMYPKLFEAAGVPNDTLIDELISLAMEG